MVSKSKGHFLTWQDYLVAYNLLYTEDGQIEYNEEKIVPEVLSQEKILIKKDLFFHLSKDAKEVIKIIVDAPTELMCNIVDKISKEKVFTYLMHERKWSERKVIKVFNEIKIYIKEGL